MEKNRADVMICGSNYVLSSDKSEERIKEIAKENNVEIVENKPLARTLYTNVEIGQEIPPELYQAVAVQAAVKCEVAEVEEPLLTQQACTLFHFFAVLSYQTKVRAQHHAFALSYGTKQVAVYHAVGINVVQQAAFGVFHTDSLLPCLPPHTYVLFGQAVSLQHEVSGQLLTLFALHKARQLLQVIARVYLAATQQRIGAL